MERQELKRTVAGLVAAGVSLSDIQKELSAKHGVTITFLDLRILAAEIEDADWSKQDAAAGKTAEDKKPAAAHVSDDDIDNDGEGDGIGETKVELSKLVRPGAVCSGSVKFGSGASADWILDQYGRLSLDNAVGKPNEEDIRQFQAELQQLLARGGR